MKQKLQNLKMRLKSKGSVLAFTLIILFIMLATALSIAGVTVIERKTSTSTGKSTASFQIADSGTEIFLKRIKDGTGTLSTILGPDCAPGTNSVTGSAGGGSYTITFYDSNTQANQLDCDDNVSDIDHIKSVGTLSGTSRAVEVAMAANSCDKGAFYVVRNDSSGNFTEAQYHAIKDAYTDGYMIYGHSCGLNVSYLVSAISSIDTNHTLSIASSSTLQCSPSNGCATERGACPGWRIYLVCALDMP